MAFLRSRFYDHHRLLQHAIAQFAELADSMERNVRLIICNWLLPGIASDKAFLMKQVSGGGAHTHTYTSTHKRTIYACMRVVRAGRWKLSPVHTHTHVHV